MFDWFTTAPLVSDLPEQLFEMFQKKLMVWLQWWNYNSVNRELWFMVVMTEKYKIVTMYVISPKLFSGSSVSFWTTSTDIGFPTKQQVCQSWTVFPLQTVNPKVSFACKDIMLSGLHLQEAVIILLQTVLVCFLSFRGLNTSSLVIFWTLHPI